MESAASLLLWAAGIALGVALGGFGVVSLREGERRAGLITLAVAAPATTALIAAARIGGWLGTVAGATTCSLVLVGILVWFWPIGRNLPLGGRPSRRVDERDIMFARARLRPGSPEHELYYALRPENRAPDDRTRTLPGLLSPDAERADPVEFATAEACFEITGKLRRMVNGEVAEDRIEHPPDRWTSQIKDLVRYLGGVDVGIAELRQYHVYTHVGRGTGGWGDTINLDHRWAIAFSVEMHHATMAHAPDAPVVAESARQYVTLSQIGVEVASVIRRLGYPARAHTDGNYRVIAPLVARDAGLGEIGRMGILMTPRLGPRVRLGVVTTDLPLVPDPPGDATSVLDFCSVCRKCAENCPVAAIPDGDREPIDDALRWHVDPDSCFRYWAVTGTDCGVCMRVCPYSHPDSVAHDPEIRRCTSSDVVGRRFFLRPATETKIES
jgi:ferredoxin